MPPLRNVQAFELRQDSGGRALVEHSSRPDDPGVVASGRSHVDLIAVQEPGLSATSLAIVSDFVRAPRSSCTTTSTAACARPRSSSSRRAAATPGCPPTTPTSWPRWFVDAANSGSLERYLETFAHTVGVMQTPRALARVARECAEDLAADGVVYAEVRFAPELHLEGGLTLDEVVEAVLAGFREGERRAATRAARSGSAPCSPRCATPPGRWRSPSSPSRYRDHGVVGFDIAGAEAGFPPTRHLDAFEYLQRRERPLHDPRRRGVRAAVHLGGDPVVRRRPARATACASSTTSTVDADGTVTLGRLAAYVRDKRIPLEMCPTSNLQTGAAPSIAEHPIGLLRRLHFRVTVNTDNRLMSGTSMTPRDARCSSEAFGYGLRDLQWFTVNAMKSAFIPFDERLALIDDVIKPGYAALAAAQASSSGNSPGA